MYELSMYVIFCKYVVTYVHESYNALTEIV